MQNIPDDPALAADRDVISLLTAQHRRLESLLNALLQEAEDGSSAACERLLANVGDELAAHMSAEESIVYPAVHVARTEGILLESLEEHLSMKRLLADLLALSPADVTFQPKCKVLQEQARHHHEEEEQHLFPKVRQMLDAPSRRAMGVGVQAHENVLLAQGAPREEVVLQTEAAAPLP